MVRPLVPGAPRLPGDLLICPCVCPDDRYAANARVTIAEKTSIVWVFSWYTIYLEIFRWHHMTRTLRFNPPPPLPGTDIQPRPGAPLIAVCLGSVTAPLVFLTATMIERIRARPGNIRPRQLASKS